MEAPLFTVRDLGSHARPAGGLRLSEAFSRVMSLSGRERWVFTRTARIMHLVIVYPQQGDPIFQSALAVDRAARNDVMSQVCAHGFGQFRVMMLNPDDNWVAVTVPQQTPPAIKRANLRLNGPWKRRHR